MGCPRRNEMLGELLMTILIGHRLFNGLQKVSGKHSGSANKGLSIVGLDLARTPSSRYETMDVRSRWMAFVEKQTKTNTYSFVMRQALPV